MTDNILDQILDKLTTSFAPSQLEVLDQSHLHIGHAGAIKGKITHIKIIISSDILTGKSRVVQHRMIMTHLRQWMNKPLHAIEIKVI